MYTATIFPTVKRYEHLLLTIVNMFKRVFILRNVKCDCIKSLKLGDPTEGSGAISYTVKTGSEDFIAVDSTTGALTIKKVPSDGRAYVIVTAAGTDTCVEATKDVTVTINKANSTSATVTVNNRTYDGTEKPLVTVTGAATGGEMQYAIGTATEATQPYTVIFTTLCTKYSKTLNRQGFYRLITPGLSDTIYYEYRRCTSYG